MASFTPSSKLENAASFEYSRLAVDFTSAIAAAWFPAPIVGSIDKATTQNMAGTNTMKQSIKEQIHLATRRPHRWLTSWQCLFTLPQYGLTYSTVNVMDTYFENMNKHNPNNINASNEIIKILSVTTVNCAITIWKDRLFARKYGAILPSGLPLRAYIVFLVRDANMMAWTFTLPQVLTKYVVKYNMIDSANRDKFEAYTQLTAPMVALTICVYLHLLGLDIYNRRELKFLQRQKLILGAYPITLGLFMIRTIAPFSIGPTLNTYFRKSLKDKYYDNRD